MLPPRGVESSDGGSPRKKKEPPSPINACIHSSISIPRDPLKMGSETKPGLMHQNSMPEQKTNSSIRNAATSGNGARKSVNANLFVVEHSSSSSDSDADSDVPKKESRLAVRRASNLLADTLAVLSGGGLEDITGKEKTEDDPEAANDTDQQAISTAISQHDLPADLGPGDHSYGVNSPSFSSSGMSDISDVESNHSNLSQGSVVAVSLYYGSENEDKGQDEDLEQELESPLRATQWARDRKDAIAAASMRRACRMARRGDFLPLVPSHCGYMEGSARTQDAPFAERSRRASPSGAGASRLLKAQGVYLQSRRVGDQRLSSRESGQRSHRL